MLNSHHLSDDEKAEALKRWWSENGKSIIGGIVIGLALVFGWRYWGTYQQQQAAQASQEFDVFAQALQADNLDSAEAINQTLRADYASTPYDYFAALELARVYVSQKDLPSAKAQLEYAAAQADLEGLKAMANVRLARVLLAMNEADAAAALAKQYSGTAFAGEFAHIEGDIALASGDKAAALSAYQKALDANGSNQAFIEMKINQVR